MFEGLIIYDVNLGTHKQSSENRIITIRRGY